MMLRSSSIIALVAILVAATPSNAYTFGPPSGRMMYSTRIGPVISYGFIQQKPRYSPMRPTPVPRRSAAMAAVPAQPPKNMAQRMLDAYCSMVWIARPDLFLYDRLARMAWDNISKTLKKLEEDSLPENVLNKALMEMQNDLAKIQSAYADVADTQRRMFAQKQQAEAAAEEWYLRAQYALSKGYEQASKEALFRRQELLDGAKKLQVDIEAQEATREKLYKAFQTLEKTFREKVAQRDDLMERAKTAKRMTKINEMLSEFNNKRLSEDTFDDFERKVETMEAAAEASSPFDWLKGNKKAPMTEDERLEMEFAKLEKSAAVEKEMNMMRAGKRFNGPRSSSRAQEEWLDQLLGASRY